MRNREKLIDLSEISELIEKAMEYQTSGKGTVFVYISGHVSKLNIDFHEYRWISDVGATQKVSIYISKELFTKTARNKAIKDIEEILSNTPTGEEAENKHKDMLLQSKQAEFDKLKKELGL